MPYSQHFFNTFIKILSSRLLLVDKKKILFQWYIQIRISKILPPRLCCVRVAKIQWMQHFQKLPKQTNQPKSSNQAFNCDFLKCVFKGNILKSLFFYLKNALFSNSQCVNACFSLQPNLLDLCDIFFQKGNAFYLYCYLFRQYVDS